MDLFVETADSFVLIVVSGELDTITAPELDRAIQKKMAEGAKHLLLDLTKTDYVSSMGLRVFLSTLKNLNAANGRLVLAGLNQEVQEIMDMAGFTPLFEIFASVDEAQSTFTS